METFTWNLSTQRNSPNWTTIESEQPRGSANHRAATAFLLCGPEHCVV